MTSPFAERLAARLWYGRSPLAAVLLPFAALTWAVASLRRAMYRVGWLPTGRLDVPVVVVGNLTVGGTGKTPVVEWVVALLRSQGWRPGIVSRGYGAQPHGVPRRVDPAGAWRNWGDEAVLLARRSGVPVEVGADRCAAARRLAQAGVDVIVSDDGLQHYRLPRAFEIVVIDGVRGLGNGWLLPAGPLREPAGRLAAADLVLVNGGDPGGVVVPSSAARFTLEGSRACRPDGGSQRPLADFAGREVWAVAGIGNPHRFGAQLERYGVKPALVSAGDHQVVDLQKLRSIADRPILMTEKDAVKYDDGMNLDLWVVPVSVSMPADQRESISRALVAALGTPPAPSASLRPGH